MSNSTISTLVARVAAREPLSDTELAQLTAHNPPLATNTALTVEGRGLLPIPYPPVHPAEQFILLQTLVWDVNAAWKRINHNRTLYECNVKLIASTQLGTNFDYRPIDPKVVEIADPDIPLLFINFRLSDYIQNANPNPHLLLIDGAHRLYKAYQLQQETIVGYVLTPEEGQQLRIAR